jgi:hypothetical protein
LISSPSIRQYLKLAASWIALCSVVCEMPDLQSLSSVQKSPSKCSPRGNHIHALWAQPRVGMLFPPR